MFAKVSEVYRVAQRTYVPRVGGEERWAICRMTQPALRPWASLLSIGLRFPVCDLRSLD